MAIIDAQPAEAASNSPTVRAVATANHRYTVITKTITTPTVLEGDLLLAVYTSDWGTISAMSLPSGFTEIARLDRGTDNLHTLIGTKTATASEPTSYTYVAPTNADTLFTMMSVKDVDTTLRPATASVVTPGSQTTHVAPDISPRGSNDLLISALTLGSYPELGTNTWLPAAGMTELSDIQVETYMSMTTAAQPLTNGGAAGARTFTSNAALNGNPAVAFSIAVKGKADTITQSVPDGTSGTNTWTGAVTSIDEGTALDGAYINTGTTDTPSINITTQNVSSVNEATSVRLNVCAYSATNANGGILDTLEMTLIINGVTQPITTVTPAYSTSACTWYTASFYGLWSQSDMDSVQIQFRKITQGSSGSQTARRDDVRIDSAYNQIVYRSVSAGNGIVAQPPSVRAATSANHVSTITTKTINRPTVVAGDLMVAIFAANKGLMSQMTFPSGFTEIGRLDNGIDATHVKVATKIATASEPSSYTYAASSTSDTRFDLLSIQNADTGFAPIISQLITPSAASTHTAAGLVPATSNDLLLANVTLSAPTSLGTTSWTSPTGMTEVTDLQVGDVMSMTTAQQSLTSGASTGLKTFTASGATANKGAAFTIAVKAGVPVYDQSSYRLYQNANSTTPGSPLASQNTPGEVVSGSAFRLRQLIKKVATSATTTDGFKLQGGEKVTTCSAATYKTLISSSTPIVTENTGARQTASSIVSEADFFGQAWQNPSNAKSDDQLVASHSYNSSARSTAPLTATSYGFSIPNEATITGIEAEFQLETYTAVSASGVSLTKNGVATGTNKGSTSQLFNLDSGPLTFTKGGSADLWGTTWTPADINSTGFGVKAQYGYITEAGTPAVSVDYMAINVYYRMPTDPPSFADNSAVADGAVITTTVNDPVPSSGVVRPQSYSEDENFSVQSELAVGEYGVWDFALRFDSSFLGKTYCFRAVTATGVSLGVYEQYPEVTFIAAPVGPTLDQQMRGGQSVVNGQKRPFSW